MTSIELIKNINVRLNSLKEQVEVYDIKDFYKYVDEEFLTKSL